ncbi:NmrA family NAD(P)-binding protein [uncultured Sphingomonas sp.]|uniref:SDR family oxidoreductase n=1 Tax=uncultured Sphingomonas sp. TaxID=158754 RepID=UPI0025EBBE23|nr:NmrA family NAD(P)-binding protein [uncultured Sphingomonas sp.]
MTTHGQVLVYGGTGQQGRPIVERLQADGYSVRLLTRQGAGEGLPEGVETVAGSFEDPDSLVRATAGVRHVVLLLPLAFDVEAAAGWTRNVVKAADQAGVERIVFDTSAPVPAARTGVAAVDVKVAAEEIIRAATVPWTILRPTIYLGNLTAPWSAPGIVGNRVVAYPVEAERGVSWISWEDVAVAVSRVLADPAFAGQALDLAGERALTGPELATAFGNVLGGTFAYAPIPLDGFEAGLNHAFGAPVGTEIARLYGWLGGEGRSQLARTTSDNAKLGLEPIEIERWIAAQNW